MHTAALIPSPTHPDLAALPLERLAESKVATEPEKVAEAARQFEAVLLRQILQEARKPLLGGTPESRSASHQYYDSIFTEQLADALTRAGGLGVAHSLQSQLTRQALAESTPAVPEAAPESIPPSQSSDSMRRGP